MNDPNNRSNKIIDLQLGLNDAIPNRKKSADLMKAVAKNISEGALVDCESGVVLKKDIPEQKGKVDVFMQAMTAYNIQRLVKYLAAMDVLEEGVLDADYLRGIAPADKMNVLEMMHKHVEYMTKFIDSKTQKTVPSDLNSGLASILSEIKDHEEETSGSVKALDPAGRQKVRSIIEALQKKMAEPIEIVAETAKPARVIKIKKSARSRTDS